MGAVEPAWNELLPRVPQPPEPLRVHLGGRKVIDAPGKRMP